MIYSCSFPLCIPVEVLWSFSGYILFLLLQYFLKYLNIFSLNTEMGQTVSLYNGSRPIFEVIWYLPHLMSHLHSVFCLTTGPKPPPKRFFHIVRSRASSFKWEYPLLSLRSSRSFLRLLPRLLVTSISPFIFPSITCFRRQFLRKMWPIQSLYVSNWKLQSKSEHREKNHDSLTLEPEA